MQAPPVAQNKEIYFLKKRVDAINSENYKEFLLFGLLSPSPLLQLSSTIEQVTVKPSYHTHVIKRAFCCICCKLFLFFKFLIHAFMNSFCVSLQGIRSTAVKRQKPSDVAKSDVWRHHPTCWKHVQYNICCAGTGFRENCSPCPNCEKLDGKFIQHLQNVRKHTYFAFVS